MATASAYIHEPCGRVPNYSDEQLARLEADADDKVATASEAPVSREDGKRKYIPYMFDLERETESGDNALASFVPTWQACRHKGTLAAMQIMDMAISKTHNTDMPVTHTSLAKGKFCIPFDDPSKPDSVGSETKFLMAMAKLLSESKRMFFAERPTPIFRFFMDLDFKQELPLLTYQIEAIGVVVLQVLKTFYPSDREANDPAFFKMVVCSNARKALPPMEEGTRDLIKTGAHIVWPNIYMSVGMAADFRESVLSALRTTIGARCPPSMNSWRDVVDLGVYQAAGLRFIGNRKTDDCPECNGVCVPFRERNLGKESLCMQCNGEGRVDSGRPYWPLFVLRSDGLRDLVAEATYRKDLFTLLKDTKIRTPFTEPPSQGFAIPDGADIFMMGEDATKYKSLCSSLGDRTGRREKLPVGSTRCTDADTPEAAAMGEFIREYMGLQYAEVAVQEVRHNSAKTFYVVHVSGKNSRYCQHINRCHKRNRIFFHFNAKGCSQKCHKPRSTPQDDAAGVKRRMPASGRGGTGAPSSKLRRRRDEDDDEEREQSDREEEEDADGDDGGPSSARNASNASAAAPHRSQNGLGNHANNNNGVVECADYQSMRVPLTGILQTLLFPRLCSMQDDMFGAADAGTRGNGDSGAVGGAAAQAARAQASRDNMESTEDLTEIMTRPSDALMDQFGQRCITAANVLMARLHNVDYLANNRQYLEPAGTHLDAVALAHRHTQSRQVLATIMAARAKTAVDDLDCSCDLAPGARQALMSLGFDPEEFGDTGARPRRPDAPTIATTTSIVEGMPPELRESASAYLEAGAAARVEEQAAQRPWRLSDVSCEQIERMLMCRLRDAMDLMLNEETHDAQAIHDRTAEIWFRPPPVRVRALQSRSAAASTRAFWAAGAAAGAGNSTTTTQPPPTPMFGLSAEHMSAAIQHVQPLQPKKLRIVPN